MKMIMEKTKWKKLGKVWLINMKIMLREWQNEFIPGLELETNHEQEIARLLSEKEIVKIIELKDGLSISTNSFVGSVYIGNIQLNIMPKIKGMDLITLMNYAYQLKDLNTIHQSSFNLQSFSFRSEEHTSELQTRGHLVCRLLLEKKNNNR